MNESGLLERIRDLLACSPVFVPQNQSSDTPAFPLTNGVIQGPGMMGQAFEARSQVREICGWWQEFVQSVCKAKGKARRMDEQAWLEGRMFLAK